MDSLKPVLAKGLIDSKSFFRQDQPAFNVDCCE